MYRRNISGQAVFFPLVSAISGNVVTGQATGISGRVTLDDGSMSVVAGTIDETGGGQYRLLPFAADMNGNIVGLYFTASGCVPVSFTIATQQNASGGIFPASGINVTVPIVTISGINIASGQSVAIFSGQLSGQQVTLTSGQSYTASGIFVTATASVASGSLYLASGSVFRNTFASGVLASSGGIATAWGNSGQVFTASGSQVAADVTAWTGTAVTAGAIPNAVAGSTDGLLINGINTGGITLAEVAITALTPNNHALTLTGNGAGAGLRIDGGSAGNAVSMQSYTNAAGMAITAAGTGAGIQVVGGGNAVTLAARFSGIGLSITGGSSGAPGVLVTATAGDGLRVLGGGSGRHGMLVVGGGGDGLHATAGNSGVDIYGNITGNLTGSVGSVLSGGIISGTVFIASGVFTTTPPASISGTTVIVIGGTLSGTIYLASGCLSGQQTTLASGQRVILFSGQLSGFAVLPTSGQVYLASGTGTSAVVDSGSIAQIASTLLTVDVSGAIESNAAKQSMATVILKQTGKFNTLASGTTSGVAVTYLCDGTTPKIMQPVVTTLSGRPISELGVGV